MKKTRLGLMTLEGPAGRWRGAVPSALVLAAFALPLTAAPRLTPAPSLHEPKGEAYRALVGPREVAKTEMTFSVTVRGKRGSEVTVELYLDPDGSGEAAVLVRQAQVRLSGGAADDVGAIACQFRLRSRGPDEPVLTTEPYLPPLREGCGWTYLLFVKDGPRVVSVHGPEFVPFVRRDVRVPQ